VSQGGWPWAAGGALRLVLLGGAFGGSFGVAGLSTALLPLDGTTASLTRVPLDLSARGRLAGRRIEGWADAGLLLAVQRVEGQGLSPSLAHVVADPGLRVALGFAVRLHAPLAAFATAEAAVLPGVHPLLLDDSRRVGSTPAVWLAAAIGLAVRIR
jgi:hypothetical protein